LQSGCQGEVLTRQDWVRRVFLDLKLIAKEMDREHGGDEYLSVCEMLEQWNDDPELTISGQLLRQTKEMGGLGKVGCELGLKYRQHNLSHQYQVYSEELMLASVEQSMAQQQAAEEADTMSFDDFLSDYFSYLKAE
jgi:glutamate--cysteine ligase